jgi:hypothetical protein
LLFSRQSSALALGTAHAVNLTKQIRTAEGYRYCPVILAANGRVNPDYVLIAGEPAHHAEGAYYLSWYEGKTLKRRSVGRDANALSTLQSWLGHEHRREISQ